MIVHLEPFEAPAKVYVPLTDKPDIYVSTVIKFQKSIDIIQPFIIVSSNQTSKQETRL